MELKDLFVWHHYKVEKIDGKMAATLDEDGNYRATCKEDVEKALTDGSNDGDVFVAPTRKWRKIAPKGK